ncbi:MAG: phosphoribosyltransferase [Candidatus Babeliales bacterium]|jgi:putative phosphoribosyl transferase
MIRFKDRIDAGKKLAVLLAAYKDSPNAIVIGLVRGGMVTAYQVAKQLNLPLDLIVPRKISAPYSPELAVGALTQEGEIIWNNTLLKQLGLTKADLAENITKEKKEAARRLNLYRGNRAPLDIKNKIVILVDDGIATGATMQAAITSIRAQRAKKIIVATPVSSAEALQTIKKEEDEVVCISVPEIFWGVGAFYDNFAQTSDEEVIALMQEH